MFLQFWWSLKSTVLSHGVTSIWVPLWKYNHTRKCWIFERLRNARFSWDLTIHLPEIHLYLCLIKFLRVTNTIYYSRSSCRRAGRLAWGKIRIIIKVFQVIKVIIIGGGGRWWYILIRAHRFTSRRLHLRMEILVDELVPFDLIEC